MHKRSFQEASGLPLQAAKLRRRDTLSAAKETLSELYSTNLVMTPSEKHRCCLRDKISALEETLKLFENTDNNSYAGPAPEPPLYRPPSPSYSPTSPKYYLDGAGEEPLDHPTSPLYSPTSPKYDPNGCDPVDR